MPAQNASGSLVIRGAREHNLRNVDLDLPRDRLIVFTGLAMSPGMDAGWPWLLELFGGRQSARSLHFIAMSLLVGFTIVHLALVILAGAGNEVRSMLTGRWRVPEDPQ